MKMELYDILTLDDDKDYALIQMEEIEGSTYCLLVEVDQEENPLENYMIYKRITISETEYEFEELDEEEYPKIAEVFADHFEEEAEEEMKPENDN